MIINESVMRRHLDMAAVKLRHAQAFVRLVAVDYDGTIYDGKDFVFSDVLRLLRIILGKDKIPAIITARAASAIKMIVPGLTELLGNDFSGRSVFIGGGNGCVLYEVNSTGFHSIYNHGLDHIQANYIAECRDRVYKNALINVADLAEKGVKTFARFLSENWDGYIPEEYMAVNRTYDGAMFAEEAKVTFVLPRSKELKERILIDIQRVLGEQYVVTAGDDFFAHVTRRLCEDGKASAVNMILQLLALDQMQVMTFGDMPSGNDKYLLRFPFSFTNSVDFFISKEIIDEPPYLIAEFGSSPIDQVYQIVEKLL